MGTAAIVGGGIGGLATAVALLRRGWEVVVYEQSPEFGEVGAGISLWANALAALNALDLSDEVRSAGTHPGQGGFRDRSGRWLAKGEKSDDLIILHRADLLNILRSAVPSECLVAGKRIEALRIENGRPVVDDTPVDLLVGADGLRSHVRTTFWPTAPTPRYSGFTAWRAIAENIPPFTGSETWGNGKVFGAFPMRNNKAYFYAATRAPENTHTPDELTTLRTHFADWPNPIPHILTAPTSPLRHDVYYQPNLPTYVSGPVALVGDAAHAMTPNLGQGACQALEDALTLATYAATPQGLHRYDTERRPRTQALVRRSLQVATIAHLRWPPAAALRNLAIRLTPQSVARKQLQAIASWQPPQAPGVEDRTAGGK